MTTHEEKAREIAWAQLFPFSHTITGKDAEIELGNWTRAISAALRECERETLKRAAKVAESVSDAVANDEGANDYRVFEGCKEVGRRVVLAICDLEGTAHEV